MAIVTAFLTLFATLKLAEFYHKLMFFGFVMGIFLFVIPAFPPIPDQLTNSLEYIISIGAISAAYLSVILGDLYLLFFLSATITILAYEQIITIYKFILRPFFN